MEKKTIGKFIAALRRANGMTQKKLGDRLYVSDKTVSRWECDECTPELSLIPAIAAIICNLGFTRGFWDFVLEVSFC